MSFKFAVFVLCFFPFWPMIRTVLLLCILMQLSQMCFPQVSIICESDCLSEKRYISAPSPRPRYVGAYYYIFLLICLCTINTKEKDNVNPHEKNKPFFNIFCKTSWQISRQNTIIVKKNIYSNISHILKNINVGIIWQK